MLDDYRDRSWGIPAEQLLVSETTFPSTTFPSTTFPSTFPSTFPQKTNIIKVILISLVCSSSCSSSLWSPCFGLLVSGTSRPHLQGGRPSCDLWPWSWWHEQHRQDQVCDTHQKQQQPNNIINNIHRQTSNSSFFLSLHVLVVTFTSFFCFIPKQFARFDHLCSTCS